MKIGIENKKKPKNGEKMKAEKKKALMIVLILLLATVFVSGCVGQGPSASTSTSIKSDAEAAQHITNISSDVDDIASTLNDIDNKIG